MLFDIHPQPEHGWLEVRTRDRLVSAGQLDHSIGIGEIQATSAGLETAIDSGWFTPERQTSFEFITHFASVSAWLDFMATRWNDVVVPAEVLARVRALPPEDVREVRIRRQIHAARLRRGSGTAPARRRSCDRLARVTAAARYAAPPPPPRR